MKRIFPLFLLFLSLSLANAQEIGADKPADAFVTWTELIVRKDFSNWHFGGVAQYCTIGGGQGQKSNEALLRPVVGYNPLPWLRLQFQVDFLYTFYAGFYLRYIPDLTFHWKASDFRFSLRNRIQLSHHIKSGKFSPIVRSRFKTDYLIPQSPVSLHIAAEPYWFDRFIKTRYYVGADFKINGNLSVTTDYVRYQHYDIDKPHQNVVSLALYVRL